MLIYLVLLLLCFCKNPTLQWLWKFLIFIICYRKLVARLWSEYHKVCPTCYQVPLRPEGQSSRDWKLSISLHIVSTPKEWLEKKLILSADRGALVKPGNESGFQRASWAPGCSGTFSFCHWAWLHPAAGMGAGAPISEPAAVPVLSSRHNLVFCLNKWKMWWGLVLLNLDIGMKDAKFCEIPWEFKVAQWSYIVMTAAPK